MISITLFCCKKVAYPQEYMDESEKFNETSLSEIEEFYSNLISYIGDTSL